MFLVREEEEKVSRTRCAPALGVAPCQPQRLGPILTSPQKDISPRPERMPQDQSNLPPKLQEAKNSRLKRESRKTGWIYLDTKLFGGKKKKKKEKKRKPKPVLLRSAAVSSLPSLRRVARFKRNTKA